MSDIPEFSGREDFQQWLCRSCQTSAGVWLVFGRAGGPKPLRASEAPEEALCLRRIDGQTQRVDAYRKYFAMRRDNSRRSAENRPLGKNDLLLAAGILLAALALWLFLRPGDQGGWVVVAVDGQEQGRYPLWEDRAVTVGNEVAYNVLEIANGQAAVREANCGDHTCVRTGAISREGEVIVCLPHRLTVEIQGGQPAGFDAAVG